MSQAPNPVPVKADNEPVPGITLKGGPALDRTIDGETNKELQKILSPPILGDELGWIGHFKVLKVLGRGGMGMVFQAEDTRLQRLVALKVMLPDIAHHQITRERFLLEARAIAKVRNDHIVTIYDVNQDGDTAYLAMEFLQGESLDRKLGDGEPFAVTEIARIAREAATGLAAAHEAGLIHRDIKPANIWLEFVGRGPSSTAKENSIPTVTDCRLRPMDVRVKILDFGLVRPQQSSQGNLTQTGNILGTPHYMSPEQARGQPLDARTDLFSLGVVLYHMCTGTLPFQGDSLMAVLTALAVDTPRPVLDLNPRIPQALVDLVNRLLEKDPHKRPASAREVIESVRIIEGKLTIAPERRGPRETINQPGQATLPQQIAPLSPARRLGLLAGIGAVLFLAGLTVLPWLWSFFSGGPLPGEPLRIGVLHSKTGTMAISEAPVIDAILLAVQEINQQGGVLGRPLEPVIVDGQSDEQVFAQKADKLITEDKVATIFGCWTSASRKAVKPVVEKHNHLLVYSVSHEGMELSPNILYGGAVPNQQVLPALHWCMGFLNKKRWYLVGSDYVFPHAVHEVIKDEAKRIGSEIVGEKYVLLGSGEAAAIARDIALTKPDLILNTLNGDSNISFFRALRQEGIRSADIPTLSFSISEAELGVMLKLDKYAGDYIAGNYLEGIPSQRNKDFLKSFRARYGPERRISDAMQTAYYNVHMWAAAVKKAGQTDAPAIRAAFKGLRIEAPQGPVEIDADTLHTIQQARVGQFHADGSVEEVFVTPQLVRPIPYPISRSREAWDSYLVKLHASWNNHWANPGK